MRSNDSEATDRHGLDIVGQHSVRDLRRVLFVSHSKEIGGAEVYLEGLLRYAIRHELRPQLVCRSDAALDGWADRIRAAGAPVHRLDFASPVDVLRLRRLIRAAAVVHLVLAYPVGKYQLAAALLTIGSGTPLVITHQLVVDVSAVPMRAPRRLFWRFAFRRYARLARTNIASSRAGLELLRRSGFPQAQTELIYNGTDVHRFAPVTAPARERVRGAIMASLGADWPGDAVIVLTVARLTPQKALADLVDAAAIVLGDHSHARFIIVGDGELRAAIQARIRRAGLTGQVYLAGNRPLDEVAAWLSGCDLFVLSSLQEGLPLALMDAMAAGCPVVATSVGGIPEVVSDSSIGLLVPPSEPQKLAQAIGELIHDGRRRQAMAAAARLRVVTSFSVDACYEKTVGVYRAVMPPAHPQRGMARPEP